MTANVRKVIAAGFIHVHYGAIDGDGYLIGNTTTAPTAGAAAGSPMGRIDGVKTSDIAIVEPEVVTVTGDDGALGQFVFEPAALPSFTLETGINDLDYMALAQGTSVQNINDISIGVLQPRSPVYPDTCLILQRRAKSKAAGSDGVTQWEGVFVPKVQVVPLGSPDFTERSAATFRYRVNTNISDRHPWGVTLTEANNGTEAAPVIPFTSENPLHMHRFTGNNAVLTYGPLQYTPVSGAKTYVVINGLPQVLTTHFSVNTATKMITFVAAPGSNAKIVVLYEYSV